MGTEQRIEQLRELRRKAEAPGSRRAADRQHERGKLTARERIALLLDKDSFQETDIFVRHQARGFGIEDRRPLGDAVVTGYGTIDDRTVFVFAEDFTVFGGSLGKAVADKITKVMDMAMKVGSPVVGLKDSGGARIQEGVQALDGYGRIFYRNVRASGVIPQISVIMGPCAGGAVYSPAITDFVYQVEGTSHMFITGPDVIKAVTGEDVTFEQLGGATTHASTSGVTHFVCGSGTEALEEVRYLLSFLPQNNMEPPPYFTPDDSPDRLDDGLDSIIPDSPNQPYDMVDIIESVVDDGDFYQVHEHWATNIVVGLARVDGYSTGIVANQPSHLAGTLDIQASKKAARFVRMCDAFNIPICTFVDVPGVPPRRGAGAWGHHPSRSEVALRVLRGDRAEGYCHHPQVLRRRLPGDERSRGGRRPGVCLAIGRDRGHGGPRCGEHNPPAGDSDRRRPRSAQGDAGGGVREAIRQPVRRFRTGPRGQRNRTAGNTGTADQGIRDAPQQAGRAAAQEAREHPPLTSPAE